MIMMSVIPQAGAMRVEGLWLMPFRCKGIA